MDAIRQAFYNHYHPNYNMLICDISYLTAIVSIVALVYGYYGHAFWAAAIFITTQLYWRTNDPQLRQIDVFVSGSAMLYHTLIAATSYNSLLYISPIAVGILFYGISHFIYTEAWLLESYLAHCAVHVFGNLACILFCLGV